MSSQRPDRFVATAREAVATEEPDGAGLAARVRNALREETRCVQGEGLPLVEVSGGLKRPIAAASVALCLGGEAALDVRLWRAVLAVQMVHEASLIHDDIIDGAALRRGERTIVARYGLAAAVVQGDHLLAAGYRLAAGAGSLAFMDRFTSAVQRTIEGEMDQARMRGVPLDRATAESIAARKSGELFGLAVATWPLLTGHAEADQLFSLGRRIGLFYQQVDDFLDFCPASATGKAPLMDYRGRCWTWPMHELPDATFGRPTAAVAASFFESGAAQRCVQRLQDEANDLVIHLSAHLPGDAFLREQVLRWLRQAHCAAAAGPISPLARKRAAPRAGGGSRTLAVASKSGDQLPAVTTSAHAIGAELTASIRTTEWVPR